MPTAPFQHPVYAVHPSVHYAQAVLANLPAKTGRTLEAWTELIRAAKLPDVSAARDWLKSTHGLGGTTAWMLAERAWNQGLEGTDGAAYLAAAPHYVEKMYAGKEILWPIHQRLVELALSLGPDVEICPCETIVPFYRRHVIAQIKPSTKTRLDFGLALKGISDSLPDRLIPTGGLEKGDRITHRFPLTSVTEVDDTVAHWLSRAYTLDKG